MYESLQANKASSDTKHSSNSSTTPKSWEPLVKPSVRPSRAWETGSMYKRPLFYVTAVTHLFFFYVFNLISNVAVDAVLGKGVPIKLTVAIAPVASVFDCLGRVVVPMATEAGYVSRSTLITIDYAAIGVGLLILSFLRDFPKLLVTASIVGMFNGHATAVHSTLMADAVGTSQLRRSNNIVTCVTSLAFLTKPILIGTANCFKFLLFLVGLQSMQHFALHYLTHVIILALQMLVSNHQHGFVCSLTIATAFSCSFTKVIIVLSNSYERLGSLHCAPVFVFSSVVFLSSLFCLG